MRDIDLTGLLGKDVLYLHDDVRRVLGDLLSKASGVPLLAGSASGIIDIDIESQRESREVLDAAYQFLTDAGYLRVEYWYQDDRDRFRFEPSLFSNPLAYEEALVIARKRVAACRSVDLTHRLGQMTSLGKYRLFACNSFKVMNPITKKYPELPAHEVFSVQRLWTDKLEFVPCDSSTHPHPSLVVEALRGVVDEDTYGKA